VDEVGERLRVTFKTLKQSNIIARMSPSFKQHGRSPDGIVFNMCWPTATRSCKIVGLPASSFYGGASTVILSVLSRFTLDMLSEVVYPRRVVVWLCRVQLVKAINVKTPRYFE
jgi:hypothetical protein